MMKIEDVVGDVVLLVMENPGPLKDLGYNQKTIYAKVIGYDEYGMWVEHPGLKIPKPIKKEDLEKGKLPKKPALQTVKASVLLPWPFISSIVHFPNVEGFDFPSPFEQSIGFDIDNDTSD